MELGFGSEFGFELGSEFGFELGFELGSELGLGSQLELSRQAGTGTPKSTSGGKSESGESVASLLTDVMDRVPSRKRTHPDAPPHALVGSEQAGGSRTKAARVDPMTSHVSYARVQSMMDSASSSSSVASDDDCNVVFHGTYGSVCFGLDDVDGSQVAVKVNADGKSDEDALMFLETAHNEADVYALIQQASSEACPQVLRLRYVACSLRKVALVFDRWPFDVHRLLTTDRTRAPAEVKLHDRLDIMLDVAKGLRHIHELRPRAIIHGDVKYNNVLVRYDASLRKYCACIMDFGLAIVYDEKACVLRRDHPGSMCATYMPDDDVMTPAFDVFSFGVLLARVLLNDFARHGQEDESAVMKGKMTRSVAAAAFPDELRKLVLQCLSPSRHARPSMRAVCHRIKSMLHRM